LGGGGAGCEGLGEDANAKGKKINVQIYTLCTGAAREEVLFLDGISMVQMK